MPDNYISLVDTHCHLNIMVKSAPNLFDTALLPEEISQVDQILTDAQADHVSRLICVGTSLIESLNCLALAQQYPAVYCSLGIHPNDATDSWPEDIQAFEKILKDDAQNSQVVAIGECGFDFHYPGYSIARQRDAFKAQIELALKYDKALIIHTRDAGALVVDVLEEYKNDAHLRGTMHCFSEDLSCAERAVNLGFKLGIGGTITYPKNNTLRAVVQAVGLDNIILETDAPYLPPQHMRGKKNHPKFIKSIAEYVAELLQVSPQAVAQITTQNTEQLFRLKRLPAN